MTTQQFHEPNLVKYHRSWTINVLMTLPFLAFSFSFLLAAENETPPKTKVSADLQQSLDVMPDVVFATYGERELAMDIFRPKGQPGLLPAIICIHGGGWEKGERKNMGHVAKTLAARGFVTAAISYRLSGEATFPAAIYDCKAAVRFLRAQAQRYQIDSHHIGAIGHSAGGHLAALLATSHHIADLEGDGGNATFSSEIQAVVPMGAQTDFLSTRTAEISQDPMRGSLWRNFLGGTQTEQFSTYQKASPLFYLDKSDPPMAFVTGEKDDPSTRAPELIPLATQLSIPVTLLVIKDAPHPFLTSQPWFDAAIERATQFFTEHLRH